MKKRLFSLLLCAALALSLLPAGALAAPDPEPAPGEEGFSIRVLAVDSVTGSPLEHFNAGIAVLDAESAAVYDAVLKDKIVTIPDLAPGSYTLQVLGAVEGCTATGDVRFTVGENGAVTAEEGAVNEDGVLLVPFAVRHKEHGEVISGDGHPGWTEWGELTVLPDAPGYYYLTRDVSIKTVWTVPQGEVSLCLNGHSISAEDMGQILVPEGAALTLYDESGNSGTLTGFNDNNLAFLTVEDGGSLTMNGGTITGNSGGAVVKVGDGSAFTMNGGSITGNSGFFIVNVETGGAFTMNGGSITGNSAEYYAVEVSGGGTFTMTGGSITGNSGEYGAVDVSGGGTFTMTGGTVADNTGAGVRVWPTGAFRISGSPAVTGNKGTDGGARNVVLIKQEGSMPAIQFAGPLTAAAQLGVTLDPSAWDTISYPAVFTDGLKGEGGEPCGSANNFLSDDDAYEVRVNDSGEAELASPPPGEWPPQPEPQSSGGRSAPATQGVQQTLPSPEAVTPEAEEPGCPKDDTCPVSAFADASPDAWYHDGVHWALETGVMQGVSDTQFAPTGTATRAMAVTMLWRLEGEPAGGTNPFADVADSAWYAPAAAWAAENGVVTGTSGTTFSPGDPITREQLVTILRRYAEHKGTAESPDAGISDYADAPDVSDWAALPFRWAVQEGIVQGAEGNRLAPKESATRAQIAAMFQRLSVAPEP